MRLEQEHGYPLNTFFIYSIQKQQSDVVDYFLGGSSCQATYKDMTGPRQKV